MRASHDSSLRTHDGGDVLPLEPARLVALREYISLWERGLGNPSTFASRALDALLVHGVTDKALQLLAPFGELHEELALRVRGALDDPPPRVGRKPARPPSEATRAALLAWLAARRA